VVAVGYLRACSRGRAAAATLAGISLAVPLSLGATHALDQHFYPRFLSFLLPLVVVCAAAALDLGTRLLAAQAGRRRRWLAGGALALVLLAYQAAVWPQTRLLLRHPYEPLRDVAQLLGELAPADASLRVGVGLGGAMPRIYDPHIRYVETARELTALCREAEDENRGLLAFYGHPGHNARRYDAVALLEDPHWFEPVGERWGIEPRFHYRVFRLRSSCPEPPYADALG